MQGGPQGLVTAKGVSNVVDLAAARSERQPHIEGPAHCLGCKHQWRAVLEAAPYRERLAAGEPWLECPGCHAMKGLLTYSCLREGEHWQCRCGCQLFSLHEKGPYCPSCGAWQDWPG